MSAMGALQIGLLDPIVMMYRAMAVFFSPITDTAVSRLGGAAEGAGASAASSEGTGHTPLPNGMFWATDVKVLHQVPVVCAVVGPTAGHVAARAVFSHFSIMVKNTGQVFPSGPPVVARALSDQIHKNDLGGSMIHTRESGVIDNEAEDEYDCFDQIRTFLSYMPDNVHETPPRKETGDDRYHDAL